MNTVLRYPGSKWRIADQLVSNIPEHKSYLEPYFGSGAVLFNKPPSPIETINDLDDDVINLFQCIRDHSQQLAAMIAAIPYSRKVYDSQFSIVSKDPVDKACAFLIKCWQGYGFKTSGIKTGWKRDKTGRERAYNLSNWYHLPEWIEEIAERLRNIQIEHKPALDLIREFDSPDSFFYLDPPYLLNTRSAKQYQYEMTEEDHIQLLETIVHCSAQIMISGYDTPLYNDYLHTWDAPYGVGNPKPVFRMDNFACSPVAGKFYKDLGENQICTKFTGRNLTAIGFHLADDYKKAGEPKIMNIIGTLSRKKFQYATTIQMEILDFENAEDHSKSEFYMDLEKTLSFI